MHGADVRDLVVPARHPCLVGRHRDRYVGGVQPGDRLGGTVEQDHAVDGSDVPQVLDDRAVAIQQDAGTTLLLVLT